MSRASAAHRHRRSVRVAFSVAVLLVGTAGAAAALVVEDPLALSVALVVSVLCGWTTLRVLVVALRQQRRDHARERARLARGHVEALTGQAQARRTAVAAASDRAGRAERTVGELEATLRLSERRAQHAEQRARVERERTFAAQRRLQELEGALGTPTGRAGGQVHGQVPLDEGDTVAAWEVDTVVDLMSWNERADRAGRPDELPGRAAR